MEKKKAVAIKYNEEKDEAPRIVAKGKNYLAEKIIKIAREYNVYIKEDSELAEILYGIDIGEEVPEELYSIIAEILAFVYKVRKRWIL